MRRFALVWSLCLVAALASTQDGPEQQARRLLEDGRAYRAQGKLKQALDNFSIVVSSFPGTAVVGDALLEIGRYRIEVEGDAAKARAAFEQVTKEHARSEAAPGAYYQLGRLTLDRASTAPEIEDALAQFARVETLYPHSVWVPRALQAAAMAHRRAGRYAEAADLNRRVALEYPASDAAAAAQFEIGHAFALQQDARAAMEEYQQVRNRFPQSEWAATALERITALHRLFGSEKPSFALDRVATAAPADYLKDVRGLATAPGGSLWIVSARTKSAVMLDATGKAANSLTGQDPRTLVLGPHGQLVFALRGAVRVGMKDMRTFTTPPEKADAQPKPVDDILAAVITPAGAMLVSDGDRERVLRFDGQGQYLGTFPANDTQVRKVIRIHVDSEGGIVTLDRGDKVVRTWDENGKQLRAVGPAGLRRPTDFAVDPFRNLYVADDEAGVLVFSPTGQLLTTIGNPDLRARAVALEPDGSVLVYDARGERVLRFR